MAELPQVAPGEVIASGHINDIAVRSVQRYANAAELDSLNPTPVAGELAYLEDATTTLQWIGVSWWRITAFPDVTQWKSSQTSVLLPTATDSGLDSVVLSIPSNWNTYRIDSTFTLSVLDSGGGSGAVGNLISTRLRADAQASGAIFEPGTYLNEVTEANDQDAPTWTTTYVLDGLTGSGNKAVYLNVWAQGTFDANRTRYLWKVTAVRVN